MVYNAFFPGFQSIFVFLSIRFIATLHCICNSSSVENLCPPQQRTAQWYTTIFYHSIVFLYKILADQNVFGLLHKPRLKFKTNNGDGVNHIKHNYGRKNLTWYEICIIPLSTQKRIWIMCYILCKTIVHTIFDIDLLLKIIIKYGKLKKDIKQMTRHQSCEG